MTFNLKEVEKYLFKDKEIAKHKLVGEDGLNPDHYDPNLGANAIKKDASLAHSSIEPKTAATPFPDVDPDEGDMDAVEEEEKEVEEASPPRN
jgi:hypothetical protein